MPTRIARSCCWSATITAVLVRSVIGEMQVKRMLDSKQRMQVFRELDEALAFLTS